MNLRILPKLLTFRRLSASKNQKQQRVSLFTRIAASFGLVATSSMVLIVAAPTVGAAACPTPTTDYGSVTLTVSIPATANYTIWTRMRAPSTTQNKVNLQVDTTTCFSVGGGSFVASSWTNDKLNWVNYQDGASANVTTMSLNAGNHTLKYIGTQAGVEIDKVILTSDPSCSPSGVGVGPGCESGDSTGPTVSLQVLAGGQTVGNGQTVSGQLTMNSTASDPSGVANVQFLVDNTVVNTDITSPYSFSWNSATVGNGSHSIKAKATDTKNNVTTTSGLTVNVNNATPCTGNPSVPSNFRVTATTTSSVSLAWNASTPAVSCTMQGYRIYRNGIQVASPTGTTYSDMGLTPGTTYNYTVAAVDSANHASAQSAVVGASTPADTAAPSVPGNLRSTLVAASSVALAWNASTDNSGVKDYVIYRNGTQVGISNTTAFTDNALAPDTSYNFTVRARDLANNMSAASSALTVKTLVGTNANKGDLNGDNKVSLTDLSILLTHYGRSGVPISSGDVNGSGKVDLTDLSMLLSNYGKNI